MDALVIAWLKEASTSAVADLMDLTWDQVDGIMQRGLERRKHVAPRRIGVDETSFRKRHTYVTVVNDLDSGRVLWVADGRKQEALDSYYCTLSKEDRAGIEAVAMDMWKPNIYSTAVHVPEAERRIAFDRFHVIAHNGKAVDEAPSQGAPRAHPRRRRQPQAHEVPLAQGPRATRHARTEQFRGAQGQQPADRQGMAAQGSRPQDLGLHHPRLGSARVERMAGLGKQESP